MPALSSALLVRMRVCGSPAALRTTMASSSSSLMSLVRAGDFSGKISLLLKSTVAIQYYNAQQNKREILSKPAVVSNFHNWQFFKVFKVAEKMAKAVSCPLNENGYRTVQSI